MNKTNKIPTIASVFLLTLFFAVLVAPGMSLAQYGCSYHSYQRCSGNNLYWYDPCGSQQDLIQYCQNGCYNNSCQNNYNNSYNYNYGYNNVCTYHAYKLCSGNNIYWYDSCGNQQDIFSSCVNGQACQYGQCTIYVQPIQPVRSQPVYNNYVAHYKTVCYNNSLYWYDSLGVASGLYKNCADSNSCTTDACAGGKCSNTIKCDGSTCAVGSADYNNYCLASQVNAVSGLSITFFSKQDANSNQWQKTIQVGSNGQVYFMISASNISTAQIDNVNISANIPTEISSLGNLQLSGVPISGDIVSGVNIGSIAPSSAKSITFEGKTQTLSSASTKQAIITSNVSGTTQTDSVTINFSPSATAAAVSSTPATSGFSAFLKRWYLWILAGLVLIIIFIFVFRRLSSEV